MKREKHARSIPIALTIAGSDSGGGAGIQADLKTFNRIGVHGVSVLTCVTAQNPIRVLQIEPCGVASVRNQLVAVFEELPATAAKTGMLYSKWIVQTIVDFLQTQRIRLVVDPVMVATSGGSLLQSSAIHDLCDKLFPLASLITPNLHEAQALLETKIRSPEDLRNAARRLHRRFGNAVLVKGGHLKGLKAAIDIYYDGQEELLLSAPFVRGVKTHGTGCTFSAAITAYLAQGQSLVDAVAHGKEFVTQAIAHGNIAAGHYLLNSNCIPL